MPYGNAADRRWMSLMAVRVLRPENVSIRSSGAAFSFFFFFFARLFPGVFQIRRNGRRATGKGATVRNPGEEKPVPEGLRPSASSRFRGSTETSLITIMVFREAGRAR